TNPDDPFEFDNNNYKARQIHVFGPETIAKRPDLQSSAALERFQHPFLGARLAERRAIRNPDAFAPAHFTGIARTGISDRPL
ncbi:hypothetical protein ACC759_38200, partial [Rhizobium ruizarguesonis]